MTNFSRRQDFLGGVAVLTGAVVLVKLISAAYKIPLGNLLDDEGMGHFNVAYNVYNFLLQLSTAGFPLALSKLTSEALARGQLRQARRQFRVAAAMFFALGAAASAAMFFFAEPLAAGLHDSLACLSIRALSPAVFFVCLIGCCRGYTQGQGDMRPTAASQIAEAACKLCVGLGLAWYVLRALGGGVERGAAAAILGVTAGTAAAALLVLIYLLRHPLLGESRERPESAGRILARLLRIGVPVTAGSSVMSIITLLDQTVVLERLQTALGLSEPAAAALYGQYTFGMTLFNLPATFVYPITLSLIPTVSAALARRNERRVCRLLSSSFRLVALFSLPAGLGLSALAGPILRLLYPAVPDTAAAAAYHLQILGPAAVFVCLMILSNAILQACGHFYLPILTALAGGAVKLTATYTLCGNPEIGIRGAPVSTLLCYAVIASLDLAALALVLGKRRPHYLAALLRPLLAALVMALFARAAFSFFEEAAGLPRGAAVLLAVALSAGLYGLLALLFGAVGKEDLQLLPKGEKIANFLHLR